MKIIERIKEAKKENEGFIKTWNLAYKEPEFYLINVIGTMITIMIYQVALYYYQNILAVLIMMIPLYIQSKILMTWVEHYVLKPNGYSMNSNKKGKVI